ncbi:MAG: sortase, partial [Deltaproteobacteria bacterium]
MRSSAGRYLLLGVTLSLFVVSLWQIGGAVYIHAKAELSQVLLKRAWARTLEYGEPSRPWPWADTWPVARLRVPRLGIDQVVLAGASGASLAFAPGHLSGTASPGETGSTVISGHRDTHFR